MGFSGVEIASNVGNIANIVIKNLQLDQTTIERGKKTFLTIQRFNQNFSITAANFKDDQPFSPVFPTAFLTVDTNMKRVLISEFEKPSTSIDDFKSLGEIMYNYFIPPIIREYINTFEPDNLIIVTNSEHDVPWEFIYNGNDFWCTKYKMGRVLGEGPEYTEENTLKNGKEMRIAVVSDPEGDLQWAQDEASTIKELLKGADGIKLDVFDSKTSHKLGIYKILISGKYDIIHYAGHADFDDTDPTKTALKLSNASDLSYDEILRLRFPKNFRPIIFANACSTSKSAYVGDKIISLASAFIAAGALAYIGTMWPIRDNLAANFASKFYTNLQHSSIGKAIREARIQMREDHGNVDAWFPYALYGDPMRTVTIDSWNSIKKGVEKTTKASKNVSVK